jgi:hypothetical protein
LPEKYMVDTRLIEGSGQNVYIGFLLNVE